VDAEIIAVGSELLTAKRIDTNSLFLTEQLNGIGVEVVTKCVVGDDRDRLADAVRRAAARAAIVILSGGLGPTEDDVTRDAVARALGRQLVFHPEISRGLEERFARAGRVMAEANQRQAFIIEGAEILPNDRGTAPGQWIDEGAGSIVLLPGPPHELQAIFTRECLPRLERRVPKQAIHTLVLRVAGMPESDLDQLIAPVYKKYENPVTTILAAAGDIQIHLRARCATGAEAEALAAEVAGPIRLLLGDRISSSNGDPLEVVVGELLRGRGATLAVAESCTGGLLAERITTVPGSSQYFLGGFVTYTSRMKSEWLGVGEETLKKFGAVSRETAEAMAVGARQRTGSTYALSITGVAGPDAGGEKAPVGTVYIGLAGPAGCEVKHRVFLGDRERVRVFAAQMALDMLRRTAAASL
jgi:nicotinamide-nucleotide amidase